MLACAAALYRMPLLLVQGGTPATRIRELPVRHKYRRPPSHQAAVTPLPGTTCIQGGRFRRSSVGWLNLEGPTRQAATSALRIAAITALVKADVLAAPPKPAVRVPLLMAPSTPWCSCCAVVRHAGSRVRWYSQSSNCAVDRIRATGLARPLSAIFGAVPR